MKSWIKNHKIWIIILVLSSLWILYVGYTNLWQPNAMLNVVEQTFTFDRIIKLIQVLTPLLIPILMYRYKHKLDADVKRVGDIIIRDKLGICDRRRKDILPKVEKRKINILNNKVEK